jgi:hypothetical protein
MGSRRSASGGRLESSGLLLALDTYHVIRELAEEIGQGITVIDEYRCDAIRRLEAFRLAHHDKQGLEHNPEVRSHLVSCPRNK